MSCPVCGDASRAKLRVGEVPILECVGCGLAWWQPPDAFAADALYDAGYFAAGDDAVGYDDYAGLEGSLRRSFAARILRIPRPFVGARLLDVGAAMGFAVDEARARGWRAIGIEVSADAARRAPGHLARASAEHAPFPDGCFDVVTAWDVLEHLPDPHAAVAEWARVLRPDGRLVLTTGDVGSWLARASGPRWHLYTLPEHLFFYSRPSLATLLAGHGFRVDSMSSESAWYTLGYLAERLRKTLWRPTRSAQPSRGWPGSRLAVPVNLFDIVTVNAVLASGSP